MIDGHLLTDKMKVNLYMFCVLVLNGVGGEVDGINVVAEDEGAPGRRTVKLLKQLAQPTSLADTISDNVILRLGA